MTVPDRCRSSRWRPSWAPASSHIDFADRCWKDVCPGEDDRPDEFVASVVADEQLGEHEQDDEHERHDREEHRDRPLASSHDRDEADDPAREPAGEAGKCPTGKDRPREHEDDIGERQADCPPAEPRRREERPMTRLSVR